MRRGGGKVELIVPDGGKVIKYNNGKGGIHHIAYEVDDAERVRNETLENITLLEDKACPCGDIIVNFIRPRGRRALVEFVETV